MSLFTALSSSSSSSSSSSDLNNTVLLELKLSKRLRLWDAIGLILHHASASLIICMIATGVIMPDADILNPIIVLILQHVFVFLRYVNKPIYIIVLLILEFLYQLVIFTSFESYGYNHWTAQSGAIVMTLAHWIRLSTASMRFLFILKNKRRAAVVKKDEEVGSKKGEDSVEGDN